VSGLKLTGADREALEGGEGPGVQLAMRVVVAMAEAAGARALLDVSSAHVDGGLYHGRASLDFAERLADGGARAVIPTTMNVGSLDLLHPHWFRGDPAIADAARRLMDRYVEMGCRPTWTCAPYQIADVRPARGAHVAWAESNAIVFANSVLGARTDRYGDFIDICAAVTGRAPAAGLHLEEHRRGEVVFDLEAIPERLLAEDVLYPVLGHLVGRAAGTAVPVLTGLPPDVGEDRLKALGAAAASSGAVALFHAVGVTPEAATLGEALGGNAASRIVTVTMDDVRAARDELSTWHEASLTAVSLGTPHFSLSEFERLLPLIAGRRVHDDVELYVSTGRDVLARVEDRGWHTTLQQAGVRVVTDTCTYVTPIIEHPGPVMTNSGKWAYYAPGNLGIPVAFGSLEECVRSAVLGRVWRDERLWS
jgi:predicted aconitase